MDPELIVDLYDELYSQPVTLTDPHLNHVGWNSSITRQPYTDEQMREWRDGVVDIVVRYHPRAVLDVGCGTGMVLLAVSDQCESITGVDVSRAGIEWLSGIVGDDPRVRLTVGSADRLDSLELPSCDLVVMNSVSQYLGPLTRFEHVVDLMIAQVRPGGHVVLGDLVSGPQRRLMVEIAESIRGPGGGQPSLGDRVERRLALDEELVLDPQWARDLVGRHPRVASVSVETRTGQAATEMNLFRFDVIIDVDTPARGDPPELDLDPTRSGWLSGVDPQIGGTVRGLGHAGLLRLAKWAGIDGPSGIARWADPGRLKQEIRHAGLDMRARPNADDPVWRFDLVVFKGSGRVS